MPDIDEIVKETAKRLKGRKAKLKKMEEAPKNTKAQPLPPKLKKALEEEFGAKLKNVRVHSGGTAADVGKKLKAKAFTCGNDIYVSSPKNAKNMELLAHELTHVLQTRGGKMPPAKEGHALTTK